MNTLNIHVVFTGGTIGSRNDGGYVGPLSDCRNELLERNVFPDVRWRTETPCEILSENADAQSLILLSDTVRRALATDADGVIVTHGSDTLDFTANLFSQTCCDAKKPVVLVAADRPLSDPETNADANFRAAVSFVRLGIPGVFAAYRNPGEQDTGIHLASRLLPLLPGDDCARSYGGVPYAYCDADTGLVRFERSNRNPAPELLRNRTSLPAAKAVLNPRIVTVDARGLTDFTLYRFPVAPCAVVATAYHSGTVCRRDFFAFADCLRDKGIPLILTGLRRNGAVYESARGLTERVVPVYDVAPCMTRVKVMLALGAGVFPTEEALNADRFFERVVPLPAP